MLNLLFLAGFEDDGKYSEIIGEFPHFSFFREMVFGGFWEIIGEKMRNLEKDGENWRKERIW